MSVVIRAAMDVAGNVGASISHTTDRLFPPKQRERALESLRAFAVRNPKLSAFLAAQTALAGLPVLLFLAFVISTLAVSLVTCIFLGVVAAFVFTLLIAGLTLLFVVPVVFVGSCTASILFLWGLVGYLVLQRINGGETPVQAGTKVGDTLNGLTGGRLHDLGDRADFHTQHERLATSTSNDKKMSMGQRQGEGPNARASSPRRRHHGQTNWISHSGEAGKEGPESGARSAQNGTQHRGQGERDRPQADLTTFNPTAEKVIDWKTEFQREGTVA